jgi:hypothetical protein
VTDVREAILLRLKAVLETLPGITVRRMVTDIRDAERPCIVINDGDEIAHETRHEGVASNRIDMQPVILIYISSTDAGGSVLNGIRAQAIKALVTDETLKTLASNNGLVRYLGCETGINRGEAMEADLALKFQITYLLKPYEL